MPLTLTVLRCPDSVPPETRTVTGGEFTAGRGPGVDWVLPDPERLLSKRHFAVAYRSGAWQIADTSTNGTTLNRDPAPIGQNELRTLRDGDRLTLGAYEIEVRLIEEAVPQPVMPAPAAGYGSQPRNGGGSPFADPFALDPLAPPPPPRQPFGEPQPGFGLGHRSAGLPQDFDPLGRDAGDAPFAGPTHGDHSPVLEDAFHPPATTGAMAFNTGGKLPGDDLLPDDWDKDLLEGINPPAPAAAPAARPAAAPVPPAARAPAPPAAAPLVRVTPPEEEPDPFAEPEPPGGARDGEPPVAAARKPSPFDEPFDLELPPEDQERPLPARQRAASPPAATPVPVTASPEASAADGALLAAFLQGAGMADVKPADPVAMMRTLGQAFRNLVAGLRAVLIARASIKSEFRIEQTMIRPRGNNPLKFSAGDEDALAALLGAGRRTDMTAAAAVADALRDIRLHELASMAAMQSAVRTVLETLDPAKLRAQAEQGGGLSLLPLQKKARAWDSYEALHARIVQALADDFDSVFGKAFARAYERALDDVAARER